MKINVVNILKPEPEQEDKDNPLNKKDSERSTWWMADNKLPNSKEASIAKAKAGRVANEITLKCVELAGALGYAEDELLEKWARDSKILDIFEGTQQIQLLIVARRLLGKSSSQLK